MPVDVIHIFLVLCAANLTCRQQFALHTLPPLPCPHVLCISSSLRSAPLLSSSHIQALPPESPAIAVSNHRGKRIHDAWLISSFTFLLSYLISHLPSTSFFLTNHQTEHDTTPASTLYPQLHPWIKTLATCNLDME